MRRVFKTRHFGRWARKVGLSDAGLCGAVREMEQGLIDAELGGYLFKKRVAIPGKGKRGGLRTIVATQRQQGWFFIHGFEKSVQANLGSAELEALKELAISLLELPPPALTKMIESRALTEICRDE